MQKDQLGQPELRDIVRGHGQVAIQPDVLDDLFDRLVFSQELVSGLDPDPRDRVEIITPRQDLPEVQTRPGQSSCLYDRLGFRTYSHPSELGLSPSDKAKLATRSEIVPDDMYTLSITVQLVDDLSNEAIQDAVKISALVSHQTRRSNGNFTHVPTPKDEQIRVLRNDPIYNPFLFEISQLSVRFVRCDDVRDLFRLQGLLFVDPSHARNISRFMSIHYDRADGTR